MGLCLYFSLTCNNERWKKSASFKDSSVSSLTLSSPFAEVMIIIVGLLLYSDVMWVEHTFGTRIDRQQGCVISAGHTTTHSRDARALCRVTFPTHTHTHWTPAVCILIKINPQLTYWVWCCNTRNQRSDDKRFYWHSSVSVLVSFEKFCICKVIFVLPI